MTTAEDLHAHPPLNVAPSRLLERAHALRLQAFVLRPEARHTLMVRLSRREPALAEELQRAFGVGVPVATDPATLVDLTAYTEYTLLGQEPDDAARFGLRQLQTWVSAGECFPVPIAERRPVRDGRIVVGRARGSDLCIRRTSVSKEHAVFEIQAGGNLWLHDLSSRNGTYVDLCRVEPGERTLVMPGAQLRFGRTECLYTTPDLFWSLAHQWV